MDKMTFDDEYAQNLESYSRKPRIKTFAKHLTPKNTWRKIISVDFNISLPSFFRKKKSIVTLTNDNVNLGNLLIKFSNDQNKSSCMSLISADNIQKIQFTHKDTQISLISNDNKKTNFFFDSAFDRYLFRAILYEYFISHLPNELKTLNDLVLNIMIITWNIGSGKINALDDLFKPKIISEKQLIAVGFQECSSKDKWIENITSFFTTYGFSKVQEASQGMMFIVVYIKKELMRLVAQVDKKEKGMGLLNLFPNKGAMIISFTIMDYLFVFVNCHLPARVYRTVERDKMAKKFVEVIKKDKKAIASFDILADYLFWFGDMNYRVDYEYDKTIMKLDEGNLQSLLEKDQLRKQMKSNGVFNGFEELTIEFPPTYRFRIPGEDNHKKKKKSKNTNEQIVNNNKNDNNNNNNNNTDNNNTPINNDNNNQINIVTQPKSNREIYHDKNQQSPSWCDRILIKSNHASRFQIDNYTSLDINCSDHKPVLCEYKINLPLPQLNYNESPLQEVNNSLQPLLGSFEFSKIQLCYDFMERFTNDKNEENPITYPFSLKLYVYYSVNQKMYETVSVENIKNGKDLIRLTDKTRKKPMLTFNNFQLPFRPEILFNLPQLKALNIIFLFKFVKGNIEDDLGYARFSVDDLCENQQHFQEELDVQYTLVKIGTFMFDANYKYGTITSTGTVIGTQQTKNE
jgi:hypothetical protein